MLAKAAVCGDMRAVVESGMRQIPAESRLYAALSDMLGRFDAGETAEAAAQHILALYDEANPHHWCHTISNAMIVALGLLWGEKDFTRTMGLCLTMGFDTDCNCATAGSVLGMVLGAAALPEGWTAPLRHGAFRRGRLRPRAHLGHGTAHGGARLRPENAREKTGAPARLLLNPDENFDVLCALWESERKFRV